MSKSQVNIIDFPVLYNILFEIRENFKFEILNFESETDLIKSNKANNSLFIVKNKFSNDSIDPKTLDEIQGQYIGLIKIKKSMLNTISLFYHSLLEKHVWIN